MKTIKWLVAVMVSLFVGFNADSATVTVTGSGIAQNIAVGVPNQFLGQFTVVVTGEPVSFTNITFFAMETNFLTSVSLYNQNGAVVAGPVDSINYYSNQPPIGIMFNDTVTFPVGTNIYVVKGKLSSSFTNGEIFRLYDEPSLDWYVGYGQVTGDSVIADVGFVHCPYVTARLGNLTVSMTDNNTPNFIVPGAVGQRLYSYILDASQSAEDISLLSLPLFLELMGCEPRFLSGGQLFDGGTALNTAMVLNPAQAGVNTIVFDSRLIVPKGTVKTLSLRFNISRDAHGGFVFNYNPPVNAIGLATGREIQSVIIPQTIRVMQILGLPSVGFGPLEFSISNGVKNFSLHSTYGYQYQIEESFDLTNWHTVTPVFSGAHFSLPVGTNEHAFYRVQEFLPSRLTVSTDASSPTYQVVAGGDVGVVTTVAKFHAPYEPVNLTRVALQLSSGSPWDIVQATIWDGATQVGYAVFTGNNTQAIATLSSPILVPKDVDKMLTIKTDFSPIGISEPVTESGHLVTIDVIDTSTVFVGAGTEGFGVLSGDTIQASGRTASSGVRVFKSYPTFASGQDNGGLVNGINNLFTLTIRADLHGDVQLHRLTFYVLNYGNVSVEGFDLFGPNGRVGTIITEPIIGSSEIKVIATFDDISNLPDKFIVAGNSRTFVLRGVATIGAGAVNSMVAVTLKSDTTFSFGLPVSLDNIVWSPNSRTISSLSDTDWFNGYGLPGLPSSGIQQTRTQ